MYVWGYSDPYPVVVERQVIVNSNVVTEAVPAAEPERVYESDLQKYKEDILYGNDEVRREAAIQLAAYQDAPTVAVLLDTLINDASSTVRAAAAASLGTVGDPTAYEALRRSAQFEQDDSVKVAATNAAEQIKAKNNAEDLYVSSSMPPMNAGSEKLGKYLMNLRYGTVDERRDAADDLDSQPGTQAVAALINALLNDNDDEVRENAAESLGKIGDRMAIDFLAWSVAFDGQSSVQRRADKAIEKIKNTIQ